jgi:DNA polymerase III delta prime subunit
LKSLSRYQVYLHCQSTCKGDAVAAKKLATPKGGVPRARRTAASGGTPAKSRQKKPGNPGYSGYEYQINVTIWVALVLMLAKHATDEIIIEPQSDEDIEATLQDPSNAILGLNIVGKKVDLILQAKTRSGSPWSTSAIADVLLGTDGDQESSGRKRSRPLKMLEAESTKHYAFVTNEATVGALRAHEGEHLFDFPEVNQLPPHARRGFDASAQASLARRILLLTSVTEEVLSSRVTTLLENHGHVPKPKHDDCIRELRDEVRRRIKGEENGRWTLSEMVSILVRHGGSIAPARDMDHYIRPSSFNKIRDRLENEHAVIISGPSGTGKTLTADILENELLRSSPPFDVIGEENGPGHVRRHLTRSDPVLFHLRDPWGGNRLTPGADRWSGELPKLLGNAGPGRKFLITSRSDVLQSAGHELVKELQPFIVPIEIEDYGPDRIAKIYDSIAGDLTGHAHSLSQHYRKRALKDLSRPYEVKRFLVALSHEDAGKPRKVSEIVADSQIDAISRVIANQLGAFGLDGAQSAAVIWAMLNARSAVSREIFPKLLRRLRAMEPSLRPDVEGVIDFLIAGQNLREDGSALAFYHPRVEDGLRLTFMRHPREAEFVLGKIIDVLVAWDGNGQDWGAETALGVLRALKEIKEIHLELAAPTQARLNEFLGNVALRGYMRSDFEGALRNLVEFGSTDYVPSRLARILIEGGPKTEKPVFVKRWRAPVIDASERAALQGDHRTKVFIERFIRETLPFTFRDYHSEVVDCLSELATNLNSAYWHALDQIADLNRTTANLDAIITGALSGETPDFERAITLFVQCEAQADAWMKSTVEARYRAEEHEYDAAAADHYFEEPGEHYYNAHEGMKEVLRLRRAREGVEWIAEHKHRRPLIYALSGLIGDSSCSPSFDELQLLLDVADDDWTRVHAWRTVQQHWDNRLGDSLALELQRNDIENTRFRQLLIEIAAANTGAGDLVGQLAIVSSRVSRERRLQLLYDIITASSSNAPKGEDGIAMRLSLAAQLITTFPEPERNLSSAFIDVLASKDLRGIALSLKNEDRIYLGEILPGVSIDITRPLACLAGAAGINIDDIVKKLLSTENEEDGDAAIHALLVANGPCLREGLFSALKHKRYRVRRRAFRALAPDANTEERAQLVLVSNDHSADMRLAFAQLMQQYEWPEAIDALAKLLQDDRDFNDSLSLDKSWARLAVARAAATALGSFDSLPRHALDALLGVVGAPSRDPFVACAALSAMVDQDDDRIPSTFVSALESAGLDDAPSYRPLAQAAAWAIFDRVVNGKLTSLPPVATRLAKEEYPAISAPLLAAFGILGGHQCTALLDQLHRSSSTERGAVVRVAAIAVNKIEGLMLNPHEQILSKIVSAAEGLAVLDGKERPLIEAWSKELDVKSGFGRFTAWIAHAIYGLPIAKDIGNIRAFDLPKQVGTLTMRSFSKHGEEERGVDDGT